MKSILDPTFRYVPSTQSDIRKTFARVKRELNPSVPYPEFCRHPDNYADAARAIRALLRLIEQGKRR